MQTATPLGALKILTTGQRLRGCSELTDRARRRERRLVANSNIHSTQATLFCQVTPDV
jgi:hypothetical protein